VLLLIGSEIDYFWTSRVDWFSRLVFIPFPDLGLFTSKTWSLPILLWPYERFTGSMLLALFPRHYWPSPRFKNGLRTIGFFSSSIGGVLSSLLSTVSTLNAEALASLLFESYSLKPKVFFTIDLFFLSSLIIFLGFSIILLYFLSSIKLCSLRVFYCCEFKP